MSELPAEPHHKVRRRRLIAATAWALCGTLAVLAGVYGIGRLRGNPGDCGLPAGGANRGAARPAGPWRGRGVEPGAYRLSGPRSRLQGLAAGRDRTLKDWRGRTVLLNLWATWCVPCRKEMPALDALARQARRTGLSKWSPSISTPAIRKSRSAFLKDVRIKRLGYFSDPSAHAFEDLKTAGKAFGMPTTLLIDRSGCEIGNMAGPAEWASDDGVKLVSAAIAADNGAVTR